MAGQGDRAGRRRVGLSWVPNPSPSQMPGPLVFPLFMEGLAQAKRCLGSFPSQVGLRLSQKLFG